MDSQASKDVNDWTLGGGVSAANPHAVAAAKDILDQGGHAVDAAIAAHLVLGLVEPQSSGLGGGAFMLVHQHDSGELKFLDGREVAPLSAKPDMFIDDDQLLPFRVAREGGIAVGVPGVVDLYERAHQRYGKLPWAELFKPAIRLASEGFPVSMRLSQYLAIMEKLSGIEERIGTRDYFYPDGKFLKPGHKLDNPEYASVLQRIALEGADAFYKGAVAESIVDAVAADSYPGSLTLDDLAAYEAVFRDGVCSPFRDLKVCTASPPSSGFGVLMMLQLYDLMTDEGDTQEQRLSAFVAAQRLAYVDRDHFLGDPDAVDVPVKALLNPAYLKQRAENAFKASEKATPGDPFSILETSPPKQRFAEDTTEESSGTSHLSIVDTAGNAVSMTATVEAPFGSTRWASGFVLNNQMTDFAREYKPGEIQANSIRGGHRPRSSMSPIIIFDSQGQLLMVTGSPGGNSIPAYIFKSIVGILDWGLKPDEAVAYPNVIARGEVVMVEKGLDESEDIIEWLKNRGYKVESSQRENSGIHMIVMQDDMLTGVADPRREGTVAKILAAEK